MKSNHNLFLKIFSCVLVLFIYAESVAAKETILSGEYIPAIPSGNEQFSEMEGFLGLSFGITKEQAKKILGKKSWDKLFSARDKNNDLDIFLYHSFKAKFENLRTNYLTLVFRHNQLGAMFLIFKKSVSEDELLRLSELYRSAYALRDATEEEVASLFESMEYNFDPQGVQLDADSGVLEDFEGEDDKDVNPGEMEMEKDPYTISLIDSKNNIIIFSTIYTKKQDITTISVFNTSGGEDGQ